MRSPRRRHLHRAHHLLEDAGEALTPPLGATQGQLDLPLVEVCCPRLVASAKGWGSGGECMGEGELQRNLRDWGEG